MTACGSNVFPDQAEKATMPVPHQHLPSRRMTGQTRGHATISTIHDVI